VGEKVTFDAVTRTIQITEAPDVNGEVFIDVQSDLYSDGKEDWVSTEGLRRVIFPISAVGGNPLPGEQALGSTFFIRSDWKIKPYEASHRLIINGNFYSEDGEDPFLDTVGTYTVRIMQQVSPLVSATIQQLPQIEFNTFTGGVTVDPDSEYSGTGYSEGIPIGTPIKPVNNFPDAMLIAAERGFKTFFVVGDALVDSGGSYTSMMFVGDSIAQSQIEISIDADVTSCEFYDMYLSGTLDGNSTVKDCRVGDLNYINGVVESSLLGPGTVVLGGSEDAFFNNCRCGVAEVNNPPIVDCGGSGQDCSILGYSGAVKIINLTGSNYVTIELNSGHVVLDSTITAGHIRISGVGTYEDNATSYDSLDIEGLISKDTVADAVLNTSLIGYENANTVAEALVRAAYGDKVTVSATGEAGTSFPIGTPKRPVNNLANAVTIAEKYGYSRLCFETDWTFTSTDILSGYTICGRGMKATTFTCEAGSVLALCKIEQAKCTGATIGVNAFSDAWVSDLSGSSPVPSSEPVLLERCLVSGSFTLPSNYSGKVTILDSWCTTEDVVEPPEIDMNGCTAEVQIRRYSGAFKVVNNTQTTTFCGFDIRGPIEIDSSVTAGNFVFTGTGSFTNNATSIDSLDVDGMLNREALTEPIWDTVYVDTSTSNTGVKWPNGTRESPINNIAEAQQIAANRTMHKYHVDGDVTLAGDWSGTVVEADNPTACTLTVSDADLTGAEIVNCAVIGSMTGGPVSFVDCELESGFTGLDGGAENTSFAGSFTVASGANFGGERCSAESLATFDCSGDGSLGFSNFSGLITVGNITDAGSQFALTGYYLLTLLDSCTAGLALVAGIGIFNEPAGGITLINRTLPGAVWEDASAVRPMHISLVETTTEIIAGAWIEEADTPATDIDSVTAKVHDLDGAEVIDLEAGSGGGAAELGVWKWTGDASLLEARTAYVLRVTATRGTDTWYRNKGFSKAG